MDDIRIEVTLYSVPQALVFLKKHDLTLSDTWLRNRLRREHIAIYRVGKTDFVTETDLYKFWVSDKLKHGRRRKERG